MPRDPDLAASADNCRLSHRTRLRPAIWRRPPLLVAAHPKNKPNEDRQRQGLFFNLSLRHNLVLPSAEARRVWVVRESERDVAATLLRRWRVAAPSIDATPDVLSGGNQQKVVAAKWLAMQPRVLLLDEPTKGVDVAAKSEIHGMVREMAANGVACLVVSSDLPEVLALADRLVVMREGRIRGEIVAGAPAFTEEQVMSLAATTDGGVA